MIVNEPLGWTSRDMAMSCRYHGIEDASEATKKTKARAYRSGLCGDLDRADQGLEQLAAQSAGAQDAGGEKNKTARLRNRAAAASGRAVAAQQRE